MINVGILMFQNMRYAPFLKMYEALLQDIPEVQYDVIYYDRDKSLGEAKDEHHIALPWYGRGTVAAPKYEKLANFAIFAMNAQKVLKKKQYDFLIILTSFPAVLLSGFLSRHYSGRFIVDIRDYTQEGARPYFRLEEKVFSKAAMRIISSPGFVNFLPSMDYLNCHNIDSNAERIDKPPFVRAENRRIVISYIGSISYERQCKQLIDLVGADDRFEFHFYGNEANGTEVSEYVLAKNDPRIRMMGAFTPADKARIYAASDLVFNCYGNDRMLVKYAISNKYYDGAIYRKPLLVSPETSMADFSGEFAYALDLEKAEDLNGLYQWYMLLDAHGYIRFADQLISSALSENAFLIQAVKRKIAETEK